MFPPKHIKQSSEWAEFLKMMSWKIEPINDSGVLLYIRPTFLGAIAKCQHLLPLVEKDLDRLDVLCRQYKTMFVILEPGIGQDMGLLKKKGYLPSYEPLGVPSTLTIDLTLSNELLWERLSKSAKYSISRGKREGARVEFFVNPGDDLLKKHYSLILATSRAKNFFAHSFKETALKRDSFGDKSYLAVVYDNDGDIVGSKFVLGFGNLVMYDSGGTSSGGRKGKWGFPLLWEMIPYFKSMGYEVFDLEGRYDERYRKFTKNWKGFTEFKEKFSPEVVEFPISYTKYFSGILNTLNKIYKLPF